METENDLLQTYRRRENEFHLPLREDGWEKLEKELTPSQPVAPRRMPSRWWVAAAVLLGIAISVPLFISKEAVPVISEHQPGQTENPAQTEKKRIQLIAKTPEPIRPLSGQPVPSPPSPADKEEEKRIAVVSDIPVSADAESPSAEDFPVPSQKRVGPEPEGNRIDLPRDILATRKKTRKNRSENWSWGIQGGSGKTTSGLLSLNDFGTPPLDQSQDNPTLPPKPEEPDSNHPDDDIAQTRTIFSNTALEYRHRMPLTVGLSLRKRFTDAFALESGLSYTFLYSDIRQSGIKSDAGSQQIHYLGIPLKANYTFYTKDRFSLYLSGGALFEYILSARRRMMNETRALDINRWQFSLNASLGAEMKLFRPVSLYLEPGLGYYFDNGSSVPTIRTERPWMFGLQLGLRFSY